MKRCTKINTGVVLGLIALICIGVIVTHKVYTPTVNRRSGYITEIYDKVTNRFIPMQSY